MDQTNSPRTGGADTDESSELVGMRRGSFFAGMVVLILIAAAAGRLTATKSISIDRIEAHGLSNVATQHIVYFVGKMMVSIAAPALEQIHATNKGLLALLVLDSICILALLAARIRNLGGNGKWCLIAAIPFVHIAVITMCLSLPERYMSGRKLDTRGKIILASISIVTAICIFLIFVSSQDSPTARSADNRVERCAADAVANTEEAGRLSSHAAAFLPGPTTGSSLRLGGDWATVGLPKGVSLELPSDWVVLSEHTKTTIAEYVRKRLTTNPADVEQSVLQFAANCYDDRGQVIGIVNLRYYPERDLSQNDARTCDLRELDEHIKPEVTKAMKTIGMDVTSWTGSSSLDLKGTTFIVTEYERKAANSPETFRVRLMALWALDQSFTLTVSYMQSAASRMQPVVNAVAQSLRVEAIAPVH